MPVVFVPVEQGRPVVLDKAILLIGRHSDCDVVLTRSRKISRKHCCIAQVNDQVVIRDLGSLNGVWVNGDRVREQSHIEPGDEISIGDVRYRVEQVRANGKNAGGSAKRQGEDRRERRPRRRRQSTDEDDGRNQAAMKETPVADLPFVPLDAEAGDSDSQDVVPLDDIEPIDIMDDYDDEGLSSRARRRRRHHSSGSHSPMMLD